MGLKKKDLEAGIATVLATIRRSAIDANRDPSAIRLVAVSKTVSDEHVLQAHELGLQIFAENRVQQLLKRFETLPRTICWHFIGHLQTNKVKSLVGRIPLIHAVDTLRLAQRIDEAARGSDVIQDVLLEVNISGEDSKFGFNATRLLQASAELGVLSNVRVRGLMTMAPYTDDEEVIRSCFRSLRLLLGELNAGGFYREPLRELSMGMTNDYRIAIAEGATYLRIGTALFGET